MLNRNRETTRWKVGDIDFIVHRNGANQSNHVHIFAKNGMTGREGLFTICDEMAVADITVDNDGRWLIATSYRAVKLVFALAGEKVDSVVECLDAVTPSVLLANYRSLGN